MVKVDWDQVQQRIADNRLVIVPASQYVYANEQEQRFPEHSIYVCDAYVKDVEQIGHPVVGGFQMGRVINIDHHAPVDEMARPISSTPLAIERVKKEGTALEHDHVIINHVDCDSVLSAAIMLGVLPPEEQFSHPAIAADHTGEPNIIADLLQPCGKLKDFNLSLRNLVKQQTGLPLDSQVQQVVNEQQQDRAVAVKLVQQGKFEFLPHGVAWTLLENRMDGALFPPLLPEATIIIQSSPIKGTNKFRMAVRLGKAAPNGVTLHQLNIQSVEPGYGGRWNAGNNSRSGGTTMTPFEFAQRLDQLVGQRFNKIPSTRQT